MNRKKPVKSFADALLSADSQAETLPKPKKLKKHKSKSSKAKYYDITNSIGSKDPPAFRLNFKDKLIPSPSTKDLKFDKHYKFGSSPTKHIYISGKNSHLKVSSEAILTSSPFSSTSKFTRTNFTHGFSEPFASSDSDDPDKCAQGRTLPIKPSFTLESRQFTADTKVVNAPPSKLVAKLLAEEEKRQQNTKMLQSVDEDLMLFDMQLEDPIEMETVSKEVENVPLLPPGLPFLHSLTCHMLYSLDKVVWPFSPSVAGSKPSASGGNVAAIMTWLGSLDKLALEQVIMTRVLMDPDLAFNVVGPLFRYLIRYLAAFPHRTLPATNKNSNANKAPDGPSVNEMVLSVYQLLMYLISASSKPVSLLVPCISELPLALVNIGCDPMCFPPATLDRWNINQSSRYHSKSPNSAADSIAQMHSMQLLLNVLSNCLARAATVCDDGDDQQPISETTLDHLLSWLVLLGQDPKVLGCSLHISVSTAIGHALQLYPNFPGKVQDLVELLASPWLSTDDDSPTPPSPSTDGTPAGGAPNALNASIGHRLDGFPHHTASYVCCTLLPETDRARMLAAPLAFLALSSSLECDDIEVLDYVEMSDIVNILATRKDFLLQDCDCYRLRSVLLLLDACVTQAVMRQPTEQKMEGVE